MATENSQSPVAVLEARAALLAAATRGLVTAEVRDPQLPTGDTNARAFYLVGPAIGYRYALLSVVFPPELYPARVEFSGWAAGARVVAGAAELRQCVEEILAQPQTRRVIEAIVERSQ